MGLAREAESVSWKEHGRQRLSIAIGLQIEAL